MSIQEHLNKIRNAIKGSEVRESIAKGIETAYDDASEKDNANMEVKIARGTHPNLRSRLEETTAQLAQKPSYSEARLKTENIGLNDVGSDLLAKLENTEGTPFNLLSIPRPDSVSVGSVDYLVRSSNISGPQETILDNHSLNSETGDLQESVSYSAQTEYIDILPLTEYTITMAERVCFYGADKSYLSMTEVVFEEAKEGYTFTTPDEAFKMRYHVVPHRKRSVQLNKGSEVLPFESYYAKFDKNKVTFPGITPEQTTFIKSSTNMFDISDSEVGNINLETGESYESEAYSRTRGFIPVRPNEKYTISNFIRYLEYDENKNFIQSYELEDYDTNPTYTFETSDNTHFVRLATFNFNGDIQRGQMNKGSYLLDYEPYGLALDSRISVAGGISRYLSIDLNLEVSGINRNTGRISRASDRDYETTMRTGKFLEVLPTSTVNFEYDTGAGYIFEYDKDFRFIESKSVLSGVNHSLSSSTAYVKLMVDGLTNGQYVTGKFHYLSLERIPKWTYNNRVNEDYINFTYEVNDTGGRQVLDDDVNIVNHNPNKYYNSGLLKLPPNYDPFGEPVRLIIFNGGASNFLNFEDQIMGYDTYLQYWVDEGYALLAVHDWTTKYEGGGVNFGSPITIQARVQAYKWVTQNFNIAQDGVMLSSYSAGGYKLFNLMYDVGLPVLAAGALVPGISPVSQGRMFGYTYENRLDYADDFGFEGDFSVLESSTVTTAPFTGAKREFLIQNLDKIIGYNPFWNGIVGTPHSTLIEQLVNNEEYNYDLYKDMYRVSDVPLKIWIAKDDANTPYVMSEIYVKTIRNANGIAELRTMPNGTGGHWAVSNDSKALKVDSITTRLGIEHTNVPLAFAEVIQFFRRYDK